MREKRTCGCGRDFLVPEDMPDKRKCNPCLLCDVRAASVFLALVGDDDGAAHVLSLEDDIE